VGGRRRRHRRGRAGRVPHRPAAVEWTPYSDAALAQAKASGRPVVLDFSADWCVPCHELDNNTFTDRAVALGLSPFTRLKVDFTRADAPQTIVLRDRYRIEGVPTIVFLAPTGRKCARRASSDSSARNRSSSA